MSATLYSAVESLEVNESMNRQNIGVMEGIACLPILLLNRTSNSSSNASLGKLRSA